MFPTMNASPESATTSSTVYLRLISHAWLVVLATVLAGCGKVESSNQLPPDPYAWGCTHLEKGELADAIACFTKAIEVNPRHTYALCCRGAAYQKQGDYPNALRDFRRAIEIDAEIRMARLTLDREILDEYRTAVGLFPFKANAHRVCGEIYLQQKQLPEALEEFSTAFEIDRQDANARCGRGKVYLAQGLYEVAVEELSEALYLDRKNVEVLCQRATAYLKLDDPGFAIRDCRKAIIQAPGCAEAYYLMGCAYLAKPQHERAVCYLKQAVSLDASLEAEANPKIAEAHFRRGLELREAGEFEEARKEFDKAVSVDPSIQNSLSQFEPLPEQATEGPKQDQASSDQAAEHRRRGFAKLKRGIHTDAIYEFTAAIVQDPDCAEAYYGRGVAFLERGFPDTAMQDLNEAIRHEPKLADAYWHRGRARAVLGLQLFAIQDYTRAIRLNPTCAEAYLCRGMLYINRRDLDLARNDLNEAKQLDPRLTSRIEGYLACISNLDRHRRGGVEEATETSEQSLQIALHPTTRE